MTLVGTDGTEVGAEMGFEFGGPGNVVRAVLSFGGVGVGGEILMGRSHKIFMKKLILILCINWGTKKVSKNGKNY